MSYQAGDTYLARIAIRDGDANPVDPDTLTLNVREPGGTVTTYEYGVDAIIVRDGVGVFHADIPLTATGMWVIEWATTNEGEVEGVQVYVAPAPSSTVTFCTVADVATRMGRDLTDAERNTAQMLCEAVTGEIAAAVDRDAAWPATLTSIHPALRTVAIEAVARTMRNPGGFSSTSETLGVYSYTERFAGDTGDGGSASVVLTRAEQRHVRRIVFGGSVASIPVASIFDFELPLP